MGRRYLNNELIRGGLFFQAEDGIRDLVRSRGLGDVYKRQESTRAGVCLAVAGVASRRCFPAVGFHLNPKTQGTVSYTHLTLPTSDLV